MTRKLYESPDSPLAFSATVVSCAPEGAQFAISLDQTAFFPEGGGQGSDRGTINGASVTHVRVEGGVVWHLTDRAVEPGTQVMGVVDALRRLDQSQQHSGEHVLSGLAHRLHGLDNVGFHIGADVVTLDFDGELSAAQWQALEAEANRVVWANLPLRVWTPSPETLETLAYRSKKALSGPVRIVEIPQADCCACCGTHVSQTGSIGQIQILDVQRHRGGTRLSIVCGGRALADSRLKNEALRQIGVQLSAPACESAQAVARLLAQRDELLRQLAHWQQEAFGRWLTCDASREPVFFTQHMEAATAQRLCMLAVERLPWAGIFTKTEGGWQFVMSSQGADLRPLQRRLCEAFSGRGGGKPDLVQGMLGPCGEADIAALLAGQPGVLA